MGENILGKNIQFMRKQNGETLDELGFALNIARSTVNGYESGNREPNLEMLGKISKYYGKTVDEMLNVKLYEYEQLDSSQVVELNKIFDTSLRILPLIETREAYENSSFSKAMTLVKEMLNLLSRGEVVMNSPMDDVIDYFFEAANANVCEAVANTLWCIYFLWSQQYIDQNAQLKLQTRIVSKQADLKEVIYETQKNEKKSANKRLEFVEAFDEPINDLIKTLKGMEQWAQLGDYYLALRYIQKMVITEYSDEMNHAIGIQMMISFAQLGNEYAIDYLKISLDS